MQRCRSSWVLTLALGLASLDSGAMTRQAAAQTHASMLPAPQPQPVSLHSADRYASVFDEWVARRQPKTAVLVVRRSGNTVFAKGHNADPSKPTLIASLSKPITGACVATLIRDGKLSFTTRMREAFSRFFHRESAPADARLGQVTVEQLLVHRSGLVDSGDDLMLASQPAGGRVLAAVQSLLVKLRLMRDPGSYAYSNTGYELLSAMIEARTGHSYEDYCRGAVLAKLGIAEAKLDPHWSMLSGAGGWSIPGPQYLEFLDVFSPAHPFLGDNVKGWIDRAQTKWTPGNRDRWYALGVNVWAGSGRWTVSHGGILNSQGRDAEGNPTEASVVSHAFRSPDGTGVFIALNWSPQAQEALDDLREKIGSTHKLATALP